MQVTEGSASCLGCSICHTYVICSHIDKTDHILSAHLINDGSWSSTHLSTVWLYFLRYATVGSMPANYRHQIKRILRNHVQKYPVNVDEPQRWQRSFWLCKASCRAGGVMSPWASSISSQLGICCPAETRIADIDRPAKTKVYTWQKTIEK